MTGQDATLIYSLSYTLTTEAGSFTLTGQVAALERGFMMAAAQATFSVTGQNAATKYSRNMAASVGTFSLTGNDAQLNLGEVEFLPIIVFFNT